MVVSWRNKIRHLGSKIVSKISAYKKQISAYQRMIQYDCARWEKHMGCINPPDLRSLAAEILMRAHGIEKGITMPGFRLGFGLEKIPLLAKAMTLYKQQGGSIESFEYLAGVRILKEYMLVHQNAFYTLPENIIDTIEETVKGSAEQASEQKLITKEEFFSNTHADFAQFSASRHTIRNFAGPADIKDIRAAVALAGNAPSACNRQYTKVHIYTDKEITTRMRELQGGTNGFGHLAEQVILITADLKALMWLHERHDLWNNAGLFMMNLCYALHYKKIGVCICAWSVSPEQDEQMHKLAEIPESEVITAMLLIGTVPDQFYIACSPRKEVSALLVEH